MRLVFGKSPHLLLLGIFAASLIVIAILVKGYFRPGLVDETTQAVKVGTSLSNLEVDWKRKQKTLVIAMQRGCQHSTESFPFYRRVAEQSQVWADVQLIALFPESVFDDATYLAERNLKVDEIRQASLSSIGIEATPTLMIVDDLGSVEAVWSGQLDSTEEEKVVSRLDPRRRSQLPKLSKGTRNSSTTKSTSTNPSRIVVIDINPSSLKAADLHREINKGNRFVLLDIRSRAAFAQAHILDAINIPLDEIQTRGLNELKTSDQIVAYCRCPGDEQSKIAYKMLRDDGFPQVLILEGGIDEWERVTTPLNSKKP
ncbi:MAG TPA: rhodanese-like domain-containing protein [Pyrinomonadaceae bacterium]|nr:rhodanese-like domain-containing protein [Pyrinomonadaceae bacterium]